MLLASEVEAAVMSRVNVKEEEPGLLVGFALGEGRGETGLGAAGLTREAGVVKFTVGVGLLVFDGVGVR